MSLLLQTHYIVIASCRVRSSLGGHRQDALVDEQQQVGGLRGGAVEVGRVVDAVAVHETRLKARLHGAVAVPRVHRDQHHLRGRTHARLRGVAADSDGCAGSLITTA